MNNNEPFYIWRREGNFWHRVEVSKEYYDGVAGECLERAIRNDLEGRSVGRTYEYHGPQIKRSDGSVYREQRLK